VDPGNSALIHIKPSRPTDFFSSHTLPAGISVDLANSCLCGSLPVHIWCIAHSVKFIFTAAVAFVPGYKLPGLCPFVDVRSRR
jgi:hypothetical protein